MHGEQYTYIKAKHEKTHSWHNLTKSPSLVVDFNPRMYKFVLLSFSDPGELSLPGLLWPLLSGEGIPNWYLF